MSSIAQQYKKDRKEHDKTAKEWTTRYVIIDLHVSILQGKIHEYSDTLHDLSNPQNDTEKK